MSKKKEAGDLTLAHCMNRDISQQICEILDLDDTWETVAFFMPGIQLKDVDGCKSYQRQNKSPTQLLLRIWASKGYTTNHLFQVFAKTKMVRCMRIIKPMVDEKFHYLEGRVLSPSRGVKGHGSYSKLAQGSLTQRKSESMKQKVSTASSAASSSSVASTSDPLRVAIEGTLPVSYKDLQEATNNFSAENIVGKGGYGVVYRGELKSTGGMVAVKRIISKNDGNGQDVRMEKERLRQSLQELRTLARFRHDNILPIYAFSLEGPEPCLVYQFMTNGSLEDRILCRKGTQPLTWTQKQEIALGSARGLHFLHSFAKTPIIHGDVKTANILLDKHLEPKLGDFGLSRDGQIEAGAAEKCPLIASHIKGTLAYLPPEFITSKILSTKLDVYSFGIVLLEIATGQRAYSDSREARSLIEFCSVKRAEAKGNTMVLREMIIDKRTPKYSDATEWSMFEILIELGLVSSQKDRSKRPPMYQIVEVLSAGTIPSLAALNICE